MPVRDGLLQDFLGLWRGIDLLFANLTLQIGRAIAVHQPLSCYFCAFYMICNYRGG